MERAGRARVPSQFGVPADKPPVAQAPATRPPAAEQPQPEKAPRDPDFVPANEVEGNLLAAASDGQTDTFLSTLLLARVLVPVPDGASKTIEPGDQDFVWRREQVDGQPYVVVFTSSARMEEHLGAGVDAITVKFVQLIRHWPDESWSFAVNPGTPVGATLPGTQIRALAAWAAEVGLGDDHSAESDRTPSASSISRPDTARAVVMQKPIAPTQVTYFLERGYDRISGFVHRASEAAHLTTPDQLYAALGLGYPGSPFKSSDDEVYVLRWTAYRPNLYRIPYGGRDEASMRAMQGWVIERSPFRGNGFAPSESSDVIAEFKVDSARLPHGAQMWRVSREDGETLVALLDADTSRWRRVSVERPDEPTGTDPADGRDAATSGADSTAEADDPAHLNGSTSTDGGTDGPDLFASSTRFGDDLNPENGDDSGEPDGRDDTGTTSGATDSDLLDRFGWSTAGDSEPGTLS